MKWDTLTNSIFVLLKNSLDHIIARDIAEDLAHKWHFMPLDGGEMLLDLDEVTENTEDGNVVYYGQAHSRRILQEIIDKNSPNTLGMLHTGMLECGDRELSTND